MTYAVDPTNPAEPTDDREAGMMAAEFRSLKTYLKDSILKAITTNKASSDEAFTAINGKLSTATGADGLPADKGIIACLQAIWAGLYTTTTGIADRLSSVEARVAASNQSIGGLGQANTDQATVIAQLQQALQALTNKVNSQLANIKMELPISSVLVTKDSRNPASYLGYGTWKQVCAGTYLAGAGISTYGPSNEYGYGFTIAGNTYGEPRKVISKACMPQHRHASNVIVRIGDSLGQSLTVVDNVATSNVAPGDTAGHFTRSFEGTYKCTWRGAEDFGYGVQAIPYTGYAGGQYVSSGIAGASAALGGTKAFDITPLCTAYYMWERTA